jgi:hypothetical protein
MLRTKRLAYQVSVQHVTRGTIRLTILNFLWSLATSVFPRNLLSRAFFVLRKRIVRWHDGFVHSDQTRVKPTHVPLPADLIGQSSPE